MQSSLFIKYILFLFLSILTVSCIDKPNLSKAIEDEIVLERIKWLHNLRNRVASEHWSDFKSSDFYECVVYKSDRHSYVLNPNKKVLNLNHVILQNNLTDIIKIDSLITGDGYSMQVKVKSGKVYKNHISHEFPIVIISNVEKTKSAIPDVRSTEIWSTMVIHELFHLFQRREGYNGEGGDDRETLKEYFVSTRGFREMVIKENELLLSMLSSETISKSKIEEYLNLRKSRMQSMPQDVRDTEFILEKIEGSGRYIEAKAMLLISTTPHSKKLSKIDSLYKAEKEFENFDINEQKFLTYAGGKTSYYYATGYNLLLLLDKLNIKYKKRIFKEINKPIYNYLEEYIENEKLH